MNFYYKINMKALLVILAFHFCFFRNISLSYPNNLNFKNEKTKNSTIFKDNLEGSIKNLSNIIHGFMLSNIQQIILSVEDIGDECMELVGLIINDPKIFINNLAKTLMREGLVANTIEAEEECLQKNEIFILLSLDYSISPIFENIKEYKNQHILFIETFTFEQEFCLWRQCKELYINKSEEIIKVLSEPINSYFNLDNFTLIGINYKINETTNYNLQHKDDNKDFSRKLKWCFWIIFILLLICTIIPIYIERKKEKEKEEADKKGNKNKKLINEDNSNVSLFSFSNNNGNSKIIKFINGFNIINNFLLLNKKKEPLSNQNALNELSIIIFILLFYILLSENAFIIIKYIDKGRNLFHFLKNWNCIFIKLGFTAYEYYKIICGVILGFKLINYYYKKEEFHFKRIIRFFFKFIPYFISFIIIYFSLQYHSAEFVTIMKKSLKNYYISNELKDCFYCHKKYYNIFNPLMLGKYNSTESYPAQYDGCIRTTLFTFCEFICYIFIILLFLLFSKIKKNILELIFFIMNLIILTLTYFLSSEGKDLKYYSLSRLFGLSASISLPYLFFPLYYIGFNIGIIYYYNQHQTEAYNYLNKNNYIPFEYCFKLSLFLRGIQGKFKNLILSLCFIFIILISSIFTFIIRDKNELFIKFNSFTKIIYVYEGILCGIFFSIFIAIYLSLNSEHALKMFLSSEFIFFINKISFIIFNAIIPFLKVFYGINMLGIELSTANLILISISLYIIICVIMIIFAITIFYPIKWIYFFLVNGFNFDEYE